MSVPSALRMKKRKEGLAHLVPISPSFPNSSHCLWK